MSDKVSAETKDKVEKAKAGLKDGSFHPWKGPVVGQDGKVTAPSTWRSGPKLEPGV